MSMSSIEHAVPAAIRRAAELEPRTGPGWTVRIVSPGAEREVRLGTQAQVARLTLELERLGFVLQVDAGNEADFVFEACGMTAVTG